MHLNKKEQRKTLLSLRRNLSLEDKIYFSKLIQNFIESFSAYENANTCFLFVSMEDEVSTKELIINALKAGKRVCLPYIINKSAHEMKASLIKSWEDLEIGEYNILTVKKSNLDFVDPEDIDFVLVPGVGFDKSGYRLGMGGGFYDSYLQLAKNATLCAAIYHCQLVESIIKEPHDLKVDYIVTEKGIFQTT